MKSMKTLSALSLMIATSMSQSDAFGAPKGNNSPSKSKEDLGKNYEKKKQGMKRFRFEETGFTCEAINKKNAERKHKAWITRRGQTNQQ